MFHYMNHITHHHVFGLAHRPFHINTTCVQSIVCISQIASYKAFEIAYNISHHSTMTHHKLDIDRSVCYFSWFLDYCYWWLNAVFSVLSHFKKDFISLQRLRLKVVIYFLLLSCDILKTFCNACMHCIHALHAQRHHRILDWRVVLCTSM